MELAVSYSPDAENPVAGDMMLRGGNAVWLTRLADEVHQRLKTRFQFVRGEWFLDRRKGVPYKQVFWVKNPDTKVIRSLFSKLIRTTVGVASLDSLTLYLDNSTRTLLVDFAATLSDGTKFLSRDYPPFILEA